MAECGKVNGLSDMLDNYVTWWSAYWKQPGVVDTVIKNITDNYQEVDDLQTKILKAWDTKNYAEAGYDFGKLYSIYMGEMPPPL